MSDDAYVSAARCIYVGMGMATLCLIVFGVLIWIDFTPGGVILGSFVFAGVVAGLPAYAHEKYRSGKATFNLLLGGVLAAVPLIAITVMYLISQMNFGSHR